MLKCSMKQLIYLLAALVFTEGLPAAAAPGGLPTRFLKAGTAQLFMGGRAYRNIGVTIPDLFTRFLTAPSAATLQALRDAHRAGARFVRTGLLRDSSTVHLFQNSPRQFLERFEAMEAACAAQKLALVPSLCFDTAALCRAAGGWDGKGIPPLYQPGSPASLLLNSCARQMAARFHSDPRILFWEIGDALNRNADTSPSEPSSEQVRALLETVAQTLHRSDRHHMVCSGNGALRPDAWHLHLQRLANADLPAGPPRPLDTLQQMRDILLLQNPPGIDILSVHLHENPVYTPSWLLPTPNEDMELPWLQAVCLQLGRPLFLGAFGQAIHGVKGGQNPAPWLLDTLRRLQASGMPLAAVRNWEPEEPALAAKPGALSWKRTPRMVVALAIANSVIRSAQHSGLTITIGPALEATDQSVQAFRLRRLAVRYNRTAAPLAAGALWQPGALWNGMRNSAGVVLLHSPRAGGALSVMDAALYSLYPGVSPGLVRSWALLFARFITGAQPVSQGGGLTLPAGTIPCGILPNGKPEWQLQNAYPGYRLPPADSGYWFIALAYRYLQLSGSPGLFLSKVHLQNGSVLTLQQICEDAYKSVPCSAKTGLVTLNLSADALRADWEGADRVLKRGECLWPSLLRYQAAVQLSRLCNAAGEGSRGEQYRADAGQMQSALANAFLLPLCQQKGAGQALLLSALQTGRREDVWGEAFAVWLKALSADHLVEIASRLKTLLQTSRTFQAGSVRALPVSGAYGGYWSVTSDLPGAGQNGAWSALPAGWMAAALAAADPAAAHLFLKAAAASAKAAQAGIPLWNLPVTAGSMYDPVIPALNAGLLKQQFAPGIRGG